MSKNSRNPVDIDVGRRVRALLKSRGRTDGALAVAMGLSHGALSQKMAGLTRWSITDALVAADFLDVEVGDISPRARDAMAMMAAHDAEDGRQAAAG